MKKKVSRKNEIINLDAFFVPRPLWVKLKEQYAQACRDAIKNGTEFPVSMGTLMVPKQYKD